MTGDPEPRTLTRTPPHTRLALTLTREPEALTLTLSLARRGRRVTLSLARSLTLKPPHTLAQTLARQPYPGRRSTSCR